MFLCVQISKAKIAKKKKKKRKRKKYLTQLYCTCYCSISSMVQSLCLTLIYLTFNNTT